MILASVELGLPRERKYVHYMAGNDQYEDKMALKFNHAGNESST